MLYAIAYFHFSVIAVTSELGTPPVFDTDLKIQGFKFLH